MDVIVEAVDEDQFRDGSSIGLCGVNWGLERTGEGILTFQV